MADVCCDHAHLLIEYLKTKTIYHGYGIDISSECVNNAKKNIEKENLQDRAKIIESSGLKSIADDVDLVIIAGIGYHLALEILSPVFNQPSSYQDIIFMVSIHQKPMELRNYIYSMGFEIIDEALVEDYKFYELIIFKTNLKSQVKKAGSVFMHQDKLYRKYLEHILNFTNPIYQASLYQKLTMYIEELD